MTGGSVTVTDDAQTLLDALVAARAADQWVTRAELRQTLTAWGFAAVLLDVMLPGGATFHIVEAYPDLRTQIDGDGYADPIKVDEVIDLVRRLQAQL